MTVAMSCYRVANSDELRAALEAAQAADIIELESGGYGAFYCPAVPYAPPGVVLIPAPGARPVFTTFQASSNLSAIGMTAELDGAVQYGIQAWQVENVVFRDWTIMSKSGELAAGIGISLRWVHNAQVIGNEVSWLRSGITSDVTSFVTIANNDIHDIQTDGILISGFQNGAVIGNKLRRFHIAGGGHPDAAQWFNRINDDGSISETFNVAIWGNLIDVLDGDQVQGIFGNDGRLIGIRNNAQFGTMTNGIAFSNTKFVEVRHNFVQGYAGAAQTPQIVVRGPSDRVAVIDNTTTGLTIGVPSDGPDWQPTNVTEAGTVFIGNAAGPQDKAEFRAWLGVAPPPTEDLGGGEYQVSGTLTLTPLVDQAP